MSPIIRPEMPSASDFTFVPMSWLEDERLSFEALGVLMTLLSYSPGEDVELDATADRGVAELEAAGYLVRDGAAFILQDPVAS